MQMGKQIVRTANGHFQKNTSGSSSQLQKLSPMEKWNYESDVTEVPVEYQGCFYGWHDFLNHWKSASDDSMECHELCEESDEDGKVDYQYFAVRSVKKEFLADPLAKDDKYECYCSNELPNPTAITLQSGAKCDHATDFTQIYKRVSNTGTTTGDPHVTNLAGQKFDVLQIGGYSFLRVTAAVSTASRDVFAVRDLNSSTPTMLSLQGTVDQIDSSCSARYIQNVTLTGMWLGDLQLAFRVAHWAPQQKAFEVSLKGERGPWKRAGELQDHPATMTVWNRGVRLKILKDVIVHVSLAETTIARVSLADIKPYRGYNYLNVHIEGLANLKSRLPDMHLSGLLAYDDFTKAAQQPTECLMHSFAKRSNDGGAIEMSDGTPPLISYLSAV